MVGTVDDKPLLMVTFGGNSYFVNEETKEVFADDKNLPKVTDETIINDVLDVIEAANV